MEGLEYQKEIKLPISNRFIAYYKAFKIYILIIILPSLICIDNPNNFNLLFTFFIYIIPILPTVIYINKHNIKQCLLKTDGFELMINDQRVIIDFSKISKVKQFVSLELSLLPRLQNIYEIQLNETYNFGDKIFLKLESKANPTEEHKIITEINNRQKTYADRIHKFDLSNQ